MPFYYSRSLYDLHITGGFDGDIAELTNLLRGAILNRFRNQVCDDLTRQCSHCTLKQVCLYAGLFENIEQNPRHLMPYILTLHAKDEAQNYELEVILLASFLPTVPYFTHMLEKMAKDGFSHEHLKLQIRSFNTENRIFQWPDEMELDELEEISIQLTTPLCLFRDKKPLLHFEIGAFLAALSRRAKDLNDQYQQGKSEYIDTTLPWMDIPSLSTTIAVKDDLALVEWDRNSQKHHNEIHRKGLVGRVSFSGLGLASLIPWLILMEDFHVGKGSSFGLGQYRIIWGN